MSFQHNNLDTQKKIPVFPPYVVMGKIISGGMLDHEMDRTFVLPVIVGT